MQAQDSPLLLTDMWIGISDESIERVKPASKVIESDIIKRQLDAAATQSYEKGYEAGYQAAKADIEEKLKTEYETIQEQNRQNAGLVSQQSELLVKQNELLNAILEKIAQEKLKFVALYEEDTKNVIHTVVKAVLNAELKASPDKLNLAIQTAISELNQNKEMNVHIHPQQELLINALQQKENGNIKFTVDTWLSDPFDFYIVQEHTHLNGELETRIKEAIASVYSL